ncbi:MAG: hypothetical protein K0S04_3988 [Herbinix sp.]|nr:hypothetical protein [Herbinix sp.]
MEIIPGYYSIKDTLGDIKKSPEGAAIIDAMMGQVSSAMGNMAEGVEITEAMQQMTNRFSVEKLLKQGGNSVKTEMIVAMNQQLAKRRSFCNRKLIHLMEVDKMITGVLMQA